ncbi:alkylmercury lyase family protein [Kaarinaea lacus]
MEIKQAVARLNSQLPLKARRDQLSVPLQRAHQAVLHSLVENGRPPTQTEMKQLLGENNVTNGIQVLVKNDLVVPDTAGTNIVGAYPLTIAQTPHRVTVNGHRLFAMCALDAVSVAPMFGVEVEIVSMCHVTHEALVVHMNDSEILSILPMPDVRVGVRWQMPSGIAAHSMCLEMVFLINERIALQWQDGDTENISLFRLAQAVEFGRQFFAPLLD